MGGSTQSQNSDFILLVPLGFSKHWGWAVVLERTSKSIVSHLWTPHTCVIPIICLSLLTLPLPQHLTMWVEYPTWIEWVIRARHDDICFTYAVLSHPLHNQRGRHWPYELTSEAQRGWVMCLMSQLIKKLDFWMVAVSEDPTFYASHCLKHKEPLADESSGRRYSYFADKVTHMIDDRHIDERERERW